MAANLGKQVGGMIEQYGLNKEKRAELTDQIESAIKFNPEYLTRMTSTGDEMADKEAQNKLDKLAKGDLNMTQLKGLAGDLAMMEKVDLKAQKEEDRKIANLYKNTLTKQVEQSTASKKLIDDLSASKLERENQLRKSYAAQGRTIIEQLQGSSNKTQAFNKLTPGQQKLVRNLNAIESGVYDLEKLDFDPFDNQKFTTGKINIQKLLGEVDEQKTKSDKEQKGEKYYQQLEEELETDLSYQMGDFSKMTPRELWLASNESNIAQRQPLEKFDPSKVEEYKQAVLQTQQDTIEGRGQQQIVDAGGIVAPGGPFIQAPDGNLARIGTATENTVQSKIDNTNTVIQEGLDRAEKVVLSEKPLDVPMAAGKDIGGKFEDVMNYTLGMVGIEGKDFDDISQKMFGADLQLGDRQKSVKELNTINMQILPLLVGSINSRGNVWTQKLVKDDVIAEPNMSNADVRDRLTEYPNYLNIAYQNAVATLNNPAVNQGSELYAKAQEIALKAPTIRKQLDYALGNTQSPDSSYKMSPNMRKILDAANSPQDIDSNASTGVINPGLQSMSTDDLNKMRADLLNSRDN
jgi:hypothetical protein